MHWQQINDFIRSKTSNTRNSENKVVNSNFIHLEQESWRLPIYLKQNEKARIEEPMSNRILQNSIKLPKLNLIRQNLTKLKATSNNEIAKTKSNENEKIYRLKSDGTELEEQPKKKLTVRGRIQLDPIGFSILS